MRSTGVWRVASSKGKRPAKRKINRARPRGGGGGGGGGGIWWWVGGSWFRDKKSVKFDFVELPPPRNQIEKIEKTKLFLWT
jgi:hypothetical protein